MSTLFVCVAWIYSKPLQIYSEPLQALPVEPSEAPPSPVQKDFIARKLDLEEDPYSLHDLSNQDLQALKAQSAPTGKRLPNWNAQLTLPEDAFIIQTPPKKQELDHDAQSTDSQETLVI